uniref:Uncharacterized protein n=1 Tax=Cacopsylla melanoneura TaxID=428564 RepID=A0A8D8ZIV2_9HEMI
MTTSCTCSKLCHKLSFTLNRGISELLMNFHESSRPPMLFTAESWSFKVSSPDSMVFNSPGFLIFVLNRVKEFRFFRFCKKTSSFQSFKLSVSTKFSSILFSSMWLKSFEVSMN